MQRSADDFFIPDNEVKLPEELDYCRVDEYIRSAEAFSPLRYAIVPIWVWHTLISLTNFAAEIKIPNI